MIESSAWGEIIKNYESKEEICKNNKIPLCFLYSRLAYEKLIPYNSNEYNLHKEIILD